MVASGSAPPVSRKFQRQQELAGLKERRIAEELERAASSRRKKEERATKHPEEERLTRRLEELRRVEEGKKPVSKHSRRS